MSSSDGGLLSMLGKLPPASLIAYRCCPDDAQFVRPGQITVTTELIALAGEPSVVAGASPVLYAVATRTAREVWPFSAAQEEREVALLPGTLMALASTLEVGATRVHLVFEVIAGEAPISEERVATTEATVREALGSARPTGSLPRERFIGDLR